jgi:hypothetical protein
MTGPRHVSGIIAAVVTEVLARVAARHAGGAGRPDQLGGRHPAGAGEQPAGMGVSSRPTAAAARQTSRRRDFRGGAR